MMGESRNNMAINSKYRYLSIAIFILGLLIIILVLFKRGLDSHLVQKQQYVLHYHKQDMEEIKEKTSALRDCESKIVNYEIDLVWYKGRVKELEAQIKSYSTEKPQDIIKKQPFIFIITPTYHRWTQKADLTRLCHTLMHVTNILWIIVEDAEDKSKLVTNLLSLCTVQSIHLNWRTSPELLDEPKNKSKKLTVQKPRGIEQRNHALKWLRLHYKKGQVKGVVYFADDDNTYDLRIFTEMRSTIKVSVWPVGIVGGLKYEGPICSGNRVKGWYAYWAKDRQFQIDLAGKIKCYNNYYTCNNVIMKH
jgi:galactosylgalactosylxylosylprotein 3-beta-glucuronosyltransferase 3